MRTVKSFLKFNRIPSDNSRLDADERNDKYN